MKVARPPSTQKFRTTRAYRIPLVAVTLAAAANATIHFTAAPAAQAAIFYDVGFETSDSCTFGADFCNQILQSTQAAGQQWSNALKGNASGADTTLQVLIKFNNNIPRATGRSFTSSFVSTTTGGLNIFEQGAAGKIRTGTDTNGTAPDIEFSFNTNYLLNELWFGGSTADVPIKRTDATSVFLHEFGHAFAFNGFRDPLTGALPAGNFASTFDAQSSFDGTNFFFNGPKATALYGGPIALTYGNIFHLGNSSPRPGSDLISDLMNGVQFERGRRYSISALDLAILEDVGIKTNPIESVPTPPLLLSTLIFGWFAKRKKDRMEKAAASESSTT
jgi:hypothetical protein